MPSLTKLSISTSSFDHAASLHLIYLPSLKSISIGESTLREITLVFIFGVPFINGSFTMKSESFPYLYSQYIYNDSESSITDYFKSYAHSYTITPICGSNLVISEESECSKITQDNWYSITILSGNCNSLTNDIILTNQTCLQSLHIQKDSLQNINSLVISNNNHLEHILFGRNSLTSVKEITISSNH